MNRTTEVLRHPIVQTVTRVFEKVTRKTLALTLLLLCVSTAQSQVVLGRFDFDSALFGDTLLESDHGTFSRKEWFNTFNVDPGNPRYLTGADFDTGIANIRDVIYTIGYNSPIINGPGADFGVVVARFSTDNFTLAVSTDGGSLFTSGQLINGNTGENTGATRTYFFHPTPGLFTPKLFVHSIDLSSFGLPEGAAVNAVSITSDQQLDLLRVAGFTSVPEPSTLTLIVVAASVLFGLGRRVSRRQ